MSNAPGVGDGPPIREADTTGQQGTETAARRPAGTSSQRTETTQEAVDEINRRNEARTGPEDLRVETRERPAYTDSEVIDAYVTAISFLGNNEANLTRDERRALKSAREFMHETLDLRRPEENQPLERQVVFDYFESDGTKTPHDDKEGPDVDQIIAGLVTLRGIADTAGRNAEMKNYDQLIQTLEDNSEPYYRRDKPERIDRSFRRARIQHEMRLRTKGRKLKDPQKYSEGIAKEFQLQRKELVLPGRRAQEATRRETTPAAPAAVATNTEGARAATTTAAPPAEGAATGPAPAATTEGGGQPVVPTYDVGIAASDIYLVRGYEEAEKQLTKKLTEGHLWDPRAILRKMALRTGHEYFRQKLAKRAHDIMWKNQNPHGEYELAKARWVPPVIGWLTGGLYSQEVAIDAQKDIEEFRKAEKAGVKIAIRLGKTGETYKGQRGKEITGATKTAIEDQILLKIAHGETISAEVVQEKVKSIIGGLSDAQFSEYFDVDKSQMDKAIDYFASNILEVGQQMQTDVNNHHHSDDQLREWTKLYFGKIKEGSDTRIRTKADDAIRRLQSLHVGPLDIGGAIAHPMVIGAAGSAMGLFAARGVSGVTGAALGTLALGGIPAGGLLAGSAMSAWTGGSEARGNVAMHLRESSYNQSAAPNAKVRAELQKIADKLGRATKAELVDGGGQSLLDGETRLSIQQLEALDTPQAYVMLKRRWAEIKARLDQGKELGVDFITYKSMADVNADRLDLMEAAGEIKDYLTGKGVANIQEFLVQSENKLIENRDAQKKQENVYVGAQRRNSAIFGAVFGLAAGGAVREGLNLDASTGGHLPGFLGGGGEAPQMPHTGATPSEQIQHGFGGRPEASLIHDNATQPAHGLEATPQNEIKPVTGPNGEWTKNSFVADERIWEHGNDQLLHTVKEGDKLILDITRMHDIPHNGEIGFAFTTPDGHTVFVPESSDLVKDGKLVLDPNDFKNIIPGTNLSIGEFYQMVINKDALLKLPNGDIATELTNHREVFNVKFIEASELIDKGGKKVIDALATIQGTGELPKTVDVPVQTTGQAPAGVPQGTGTEKPPAGGAPQGPGTQKPPLAGKPSVVESAKPPVGGAPPEGAKPLETAKPSASPTVEPSRSPLQSAVPSATPSPTPSPSLSTTPTPTPGAAGSSAFSFGNEPLVPVFRQAFVGTPEEMRQQEARIAGTEGEHGPRPQEGEPVDQRLEQMFAGLRNPVIENNNRYFVGRPPDEITLTAAEMTALEQRVPFFETHGVGGWKAREQAVPYVWDNIIGFDRNPRFNEAENLTQGDSGLLALAANAARTPAEQARLYRGLSQAVIKVHENNPNLIDQWLEAQDEFSRRVFMAHDQEYDRRSGRVDVSAKEHLIRTRADIVWEDRIQELKTAIANRQLQSHHLRWIEFLSHSVKVQDLVAKAQRQQRPTAPARTAPPAPRPVAPTGGGEPHPPITPSPQPAPAEGITGPTGGAQATIPRPAPELTRAEAVRGITKGLAEAMKPLGERLRRIHSAWEAEQKRLGRALTVDEMNKIQRDLPYASESEIKLLKDQGYTDSEIRRMDVGEAEQILRGEKRKAEDAAEAVIVETDRTRRELGIPQVEVPGAPERETPEPRVGMIIRSGETGEEFRILGFDFEVPKGMHNVVIENVRTGQARDISRDEFDRRVATSEFALEEPEPATPAPVEVQSGLEVFTRDGTSYSVANVDPANNRVELAGEDATRAPVSLPLSDFRATLGSTEGLWSREKPTFPPEEAVGPAAGALEHRAGPEPELTAAPAPIAEPEGAQSEAEGPSVTAAEPVVESEADLEARREFIKLTGGQADPNMPIDLVRARLEQLRGHVQEIAESFVSDELIRPLSDAQVMDILKKTEEGGLLEISVDEISRRLDQRDRETREAIQKALEGKFIERAKTGKGFVLGSKLRNAIKGSFGKIRNQLGRRTIEEPTQTEPSLSREEPTTIPVEETPEERARRVYLDAQARKDKIAEQKRKDKEKKPGPLARLRGGRKKKAEKNVEAAPAVSPAEEADLTQQAVEALRAEHPDLNLSFSDALRMLEEKRRKKEKE